MEKQIPAILVERDYKGEYERFALTPEEFQKEFPETYAHFGPITEANSDTLKPLVHIWFCPCMVGDETWTKFFTDMTDGLPDSDVDNGNHAYIARRFFGALAEYVADIFMVGEMVYASDWCYGMIIDIEDGIASVEFDTAGGGGTLGFELSELKHAEN